MIFNYSYPKELDISNSFVTDRGLLAVCGVEVVEREGEKPKEEERRERGKVNPRTGRFVRAAAAKATETIDRVK